MSGRRVNVEDEIKAGRLQRIVVGDVTAPQLVSKAERLLRASKVVLDSDPDAAYVLAYDAARFAGTAILASRNLRPTARGGHLVVESVLAAWFGDRVDGFGTLRRRRNELEYPREYVEVTTRAEATAALDVAGDLLDLARAEVGPA